MTRLQLARGYADGTLTPYQKMVAEQFPLVIQQAKAYIAEKNKPKIISKPIWKGKKNG